MRTSLEHVPPHSIEAELCTLGSMMLDRNAVEKVGDILKPEDFYRESHRIIYDVILSLAERHVPVDLVTVREELTRRNELERAGGLAYLATVVESVPTAANAEYYARIVEEKAILRRLMQASYEILRMVEQAEEEIEDIVDYAEQKIFNVAQRRLGQYFTPIDQLLLKVLDRVEAMQQSGKTVLGVPTYFRDLDRVTCGLQEGELIILAARPSMGKTSLALNIAENVALRSKLPVAIFSLEMAKEQLVQRMICSQAGVNAQRIRLGTLSQEDWDRLQNACERLFKAPIFIDDATDLSVLELRGKCRRLQAEHGLGLVIIDYLQLMRSPRRSENRNQEIAEIARGLKALARDLNVPVIALSQLSRAVEKREDKRPMLSDLRESGSIEAEADVVIFIHRPAYYTKELYSEYEEEEEGDHAVERTEETEIIIAKQRNGPTRTVKLAFQPKYTRFMTLERATPP